MFSLLLAVLYPVLIIFTGSFIPQLFRPNISYKLGAYGRLYSRIEELKRQNENIDLLFLGSSHAYRGFDTRNFNSASSFNLGSSAQSPLNTRVLLKRYLDKLNPETVIYEVYPGSFSGDGVESALDIISNDRNDFHSFKMASETKNVKVYNTLIYATFRDLLSLNKEFKDTIGSADRYIKGGFVESDLKYFRQINHKPREWTFESEQLKAFNENLDLLKQKSNRIILVFAPITSRLYKSHRNNFYMDSLMKSYGVEYYNFNELMSLNDSLDFYDTHHLNQNGVNKFNDALQEILTKK